MHWEYWSFLSIILPPPPKKKSIWNPVFHSSIIALSSVLSVTTHRFYSPSDFRAFPWKWDTVCLSQVLHCRLQICLWLVTYKCWEFSGPEVAFINSLATSSIPVFSPPLKSLGKVDYGSLWSLGNGWSPWVYDVFRGRKALPQCRKAFRWKLSACWLVGEGFSWKKWFHETRQKPSQPTESSASC